MSPSLASLVPLANLGLAFSSFLFLITLSPNRPTSKSFLPSKYFSHPPPSLYLHRNHQFRKGPWSWTYKAGHGLSPSPHCEAWTLLAVPEVVTDWKTAQGCNVLTLSHCPLQVYYTVVSANILYYVRTLCGGVVCNAHKKIIDCRHPRVFILHLKLHVVLSQSPLPSNWECRVRKK